MLQDCGRNAAIGISTIIIYADKSGFKVLLRSLYPKNTPGRTVLHAVPSMMMQPISSEITQEFSVTHN